MQRIPRLPWSILDTDLYKLTMMQAVYHQYPSLRVRYTFTNRGETAFPPGFAEELRRQIQYMADLQLTGDELRWALQNPSLQFMKRDFWEFLSKYWFDPCEVNIEQTGGQLSITVQGYWHRTILWEVPLLALVSELYYLMLGIEINDTIFRDHLAEKQKKLMEAGCKFIDFGTRRRFSYHVQVMVVFLMAANCPNHFMGTSNVFLAKEFGLRPIGTCAHEWFMAHQCMFGAREATRRALQAWQKEYGTALGTALTDTFTTPVFLRDIGEELTRTFQGFRQDSGDPFEIGHLFLEHWRKYGIDPKTKLVVFSDSLDADRAVALQEEFSHRTNVSFGIGTNFTNDVGAVPLNIVIKLSACQLEPGGLWIPGSKLSDTRGKIHGAQEVVASIKQELGI